MWGVSHSEVRWVWGVSHSEVRWVWEVYHSEVRWVNTSVSPVASIASMVNNLWSPDKWAIIRSSMLLKSGTCEGVGMMGKVRVEG